MTTSAAEAHQSQRALEESRSDLMNGSSKLRLSLYELLEPSFENHRDKVAVICGEETLTFGQLSSLIHRLSKALIQRRIGNGALVGVALDRCVELVAVLLAILKAGAAYVPIEPALPAERINRMMGNACPELIITDADTLDTSALSKELTCLSIAEALNTTDTGLSGSNIGHTAAQPGDLAYVMYTSGSTGEPKGVEITQQGITNLLLSMQREPGCDETDRLLAITTVSFDMAVVDWFLPLFCGATLVIAQKAELTDMAALVRLMDRHQISIMQGTPTVWQMLLDSGWCGQPRLKKIFSAGEALPRGLADRLLDCSDSVWNLYGATEASVYSSLWEVRRDHDMIIGGAIGNTHLYILDEDMSPVPTGSPGELCLGGFGVGRGYRNNTKLTRARFPSNPFHPGLMYRTGDVARFTTPGKVAIMGRMDGQVKIRGHRIELGEIEAAITAHQDISTSVVIGRDDRLVAYCIRSTEVPRHEKPGVNRRGANGETLERVGRMLRPWLASRLPAYMIPAFFVELEAFPVSVSGKIDRKALPDPIADLHTTNAASMPASELEGQLLLIWSRVLGHDHVTINDNFFEVGGDSLRAVRVQKELEKLLDRSVPAAKLFEHYTIKALATYLTRGTRDLGQKPTITSSSHPCSDDHDIAVVSMACRLPGGISTPEEFWELLETGGDAITDVPKDRWNDIVNSDDKDEMFCTRGGFLPAVNSFDISFFGISPREARRLDPSQYLLLETCWEAFERAGYTTEQLRGSQTGVFIGASNILAHQSLNKGAIQDLAELDGYTVTGSAGGTMSGRISYHLGLHGPTMTVDTACSSSLVSTHLACTALRQGECSMAVSGGVSLMLNPGLHVEFSRLQGMSPDGRCRSFSADTNGTGWSEGSAVVLLKRLSDAQRDGDHIHAVIRGTAVNHDGRSATLTAPSGPAQERLVCQALAAARLQPGDIDYIETHGTATKLGDPIEATALAEVFGPSRAFLEPLLIGAAKSNIGHTQAASGLVGLFKVVLALQHCVLPQTLHVTKPTPAVDWQRANMAPVMSQRPWPAQENRLRRAGVSAFGIGGTNAHAVVEEPPRQKAVANGVKKLARLPHSMPFLLSANSQEALRLQAEKLHRHISNPAHEDSPDDMAYSLATTRNHFRKRIVLTASDKTELLKELHSFAHPDSISLSAGSEAAEAAKLAMLFTGQGSQWTGMGKDLSEVFPLFDETLREIATLFDTILESPLLDVMWAESDSPAAALLDRTDFAQPALFALEVSLWRLWQSWGVTPDSVLGHSLGEVVAAHVAGIFDLGDACRLVAARGRLMQAQSGDHSMVSIEASAAEVAIAAKQLGRDTDIDVAAYNTPTHTVISGKTDAVENVSSYFTGQGRKTKTLVVGHAFHSRHMDGMLSDFRAVAETVQFHSPKLGIISSLEGSMAREGQLQTADYWVSQVRKPVRFSDGMQTLARSGVNMFIELGPDPVLCGMGATCLPDHDKPRFIEWLSSLGRGKNSTSVLQRSLARLHTRHVPIDWQAYFKPFGCHRVQLPTYAFQRDFHLDHHLNTQLNGPSLTNDTQIKGGDSISHSDKLESHSNQFTIEWRAVKSVEVPRTRTWGLRTLAARSNWAKDVIATLPQSGIKVVPIEQLKDAEELEGLLYLWDSGTNGLSHTQDMMAEALYQLQTAARDQFVPTIVWVTQQAIGTGNEHDDRTMNPGPESLLWGLMRTARSEHPELNLRLVDLGQNTSDTSIISGLVLNNEPECAVRQGQVLVPRLQRVDPVPQARLDKHQLVRPDGAVLITGGLGDIGSRVARWLVTSHGVGDLVLTSRHGSSALGADTLVAELSKLGARVNVLAGDVANADSVNSIVSVFTKDRPLRGVVHAAGVVDSGVLSTMTPEQCETTIRPKVFGAWNLHQRTQGMDLDLFMMFSSISGVMGMPGLANYAASNTFLDALAYLRRAQGLPATSVAYGTWESNVGMVSKLGRATLAHLTHYGLDPLSSDQGLDLFQQAVVSKRPLTMAANLDTDRLRAYLEEQGGAIPPLLDSLLKRQGVVARSSTSSRRHLRQILSEAEPKKHAAIVLDMVRQVVAKTLGFTNPLDVEVDRPLKDIGIDSLTAVQVRNHLATLTDLTLSTNLVYFHPNLQLLSQSLLNQLQETDSSLITAATTSRLDITAICKGCLDSSFEFGNATQNRSGQCTRRPESVLLTGATGFVGAFVLHELLEQGITTHCLVRAHSVEQAQRRLVTTLQEYSLWKPEYEDLVKPLVGDMAQPLLGLTDQVFDELAHSIDVICHSGALVDWLRPLQDYVGPNIISAYEILRLASRGRTKAIHLVSTISTLPKHMGLDLTEKDLEYGYGTSKYIAEKLVAAARWRGARAAIYRLPYVTASATSGQFRRDRGDFLHNLITGCLDMGAFPSVRADLSAVLPVDYLAKTIVAIMTHDSHRIGQDFDFLSTRAPTCIDFFKLVSSLSGEKPREMLEFGVWKGRALDHAASHPTSPLARITAVLDGYTDENAATLFKVLPVGANVLGGEDYPAPFLDEEFARAYLQCIQASSDGG